VCSKSGFANWIAAALLVMLAPPICLLRSRASHHGRGDHDSAVNQRPPGLQFVGIDQHLNAEVPVDLEFRDELGNPVKLADYLATDVRSF